MRHILFAVLILALGACGRGVDARLERADALMEDHPDSALAIISAIDTAELRGDRNRAEYGLLLTQARHKCDYVDTDDSLISAAARYFDDHGPARRKMLARFYHAQVLENAGNRSAALARALPVIDLATDLGDTYWLARTHELIGYIYAYGYKMNESISHSIEAARYFRNTGHDLNEIYCLLSAARSMDHNGYHVESLSFLDSIKGATSIVDSTAIGFLYESYVRPYIALTKYDEAISAHKIGVEYLGETGKYLVDWMDIAEAYLKLGDAEGYENCYNLGLEFVNIPTQKNILSYEIYTSEGRYKEALLELDTIHAATKRAFEKLLKDDLDAILASYYYSNLENERTAYKNKSAIYGLLIILFWVIIILVLVINRSQLRKKRDEIELSVLHTRTLIKEIAEKTDLIDGLNTKIDISERIVAQLSKEILLSKDCKINLSEQFRFLDRLCDDLLKIDNLESCEARNLYVQLKLHIRSIIEGDSLLSLKHLVDSQHNNILSRLKSSVKGINYSDEVLVTLRLLGLSSKSICLIMGIKLANYHNRLARIRNKIKVSEAPELNGVLNSIHK